MENIIPSGYDQNIPFILRHYQVLPKYYFLSQSRINTLVCVMNMGTGKTALAIYMFLDYINKYRKSQFIDDTIDVPNDSHMSTILVRKPNVYFIGSWNSAFACKQDLLNSAFDFYDNDVLTKLKELLNSSNPANVEEGRRYKQYLLRDTVKYINFIGYQSFVNLLFPNLFQKLMQDPELLIDQWKAGTLSIDKSILEDFRDCFIVVDEMQRLYSTRGLNSYGVSIMVLHKYANEYNMRFLFLTGTIINTILPEFTCVANIISDDNKFIEFTEWTTKRNIRSEYDRSDMFIYEIKKNKSQEIYDLLSPRMFFYTPDSDDERSDPTLSKCNVPSYLAIDNGLKYLTFPNKENYPQEVQVGNCIIDKDRMIVIKCKVQGIQADRYAEYLKTASLETSFDDQMSGTLSNSSGDNGKKILPQDAGFPLNEKEWHRHGIVRVDNLFHGSFLDIENIKNYSVVGYYMYKYALANALKQEKTIIYHIRLNGFGLYQYGEILEYNGFVRYESSVKNSSLCMNCGKPFSKHSLPLNEKLKEKVCQTFQPIVYSYLTGDINQTDRDDLVNNVYNSPQNADGHIINLLFVSDVAYSGISFLNTNNIFVLSRIPNISKWRQICARIIRNKSHSLIKNKQAKIWTFIVYHEDEPEMSFGERYYKLRLLYDESVNKFLTGISRRSIGQTILNNPELYKMNTNESIRFHELLTNDLKRALKTVLNEIFKDKSCVWELNSLIERIQSTTTSITPVNMTNLPRDYILKFIFNSRLNIFKYAKPINGVSKIYVSRNIEPEEQSINQIITFGQIQSVMYEKKSIRIFIDMLYKPDDYNKKIRIIGQLIKMTEKNLKVLSPIDIFWQVNFDIHNEYYPDDEVNFFKNHTPSNRDPGKAVGIYCNDSIIFRDGTKKLIKFKFIEKIPGWRSKRYIFAITPFKKTETSPFLLHILFEPQVKRIVKDLRKAERPVQCSTTTLKRLGEEFPQLKNSPEKTWCRDVIGIISKYQYEHPNEKGCYSPFEK